MNIFDQIRSEAARAKVIQTNWTALAQAHLDPEIDPWEGWQDDAPQMGQAPELEYTLESETAIDGCDYTGQAAGYAYDLNFWEEEGATYSSRAQVPDLLGSPTDENHNNGKRGGYDRPDMLGIDWARLAVKDAPARRTARAYVCRPSICPHDKKTVIPLYFDRGTVRQRKRRHEIQVDFTTGYGQGYSAEEDDYGPKPMPAFKLAPMQGPKSSLRHPTLARKENTARFIGWLLPKHKRAAELGQARGWLDRKLKAHPGEDDQMVLIARARKWVSEIDPTLDTHAFLTHGLLKKKAETQAIKTQTSAR